MASEFDVYSFVKGEFGVEIVGQGKNGTYDTVHLYIQPFSRNNDKLAVDEYVGRYAETPSWSKIFTLSENDLSDAIKIYNNYVVSSDRIDVRMIDKEIYKEVKMRLNDVFEIKESKKSTKKSLKEKVTVAKSLKIIERALLDLIHDDTIQEEFNMAFDDVNGIYDSVDDMFEVSVHNVLNKLLKEHTITVLPF